MKKLLAITAIASLFCASQASAIVKYYELGDNSSSVEANSADPGLVIQTQVYNLTGYNFTLDDGQSHTFDFFKIWTNETDVGWDDLAPQSIVANLAFAVPSYTGLVGGSTVGYFQLFGLIQGGAVSWEAPELITLADREFTIKLFDATFNEGFLGLDEGLKHGAIIKATVTQISSVPDTGATLAMLGLGLLGLAGMRRRFAK